MAGCRSHSASWLPNARANAEMSHVENGIKVLDIAYPFGNAPIRFRIVGAAGLRPGTG